MNLPDAWKPVLQRRSVADKIAVPRDCELCPVHLLPVVAEMVQQGVIRWIDRARARARVNGSPRLSYFDCDIYQLTLKGIKLCNDNGIEQR